MLCEWDQTRLLREVPSTTWMAGQWESPFTDPAAKEKAAQIIQNGKAYLEVAVHGVGHEFWDRGRMLRSEFHDTQGKMRPRDLVKKHLEYFFKLMNSFGLAHHPRIFIPPALKPRVSATGQKASRPLPAPLVSSTSAWSFPGQTAVLPPNSLGLAGKKAFCSWNGGDPRQKWYRVAATPEFQLHLSHPCLALANILHPRSR